MTTLAFDVLWRDRGASRGLQGLGKDADVAHDRLDRVRSIGPRLGAAFAGLAVGDFLKDSVTAASDLNEVMSKSQAIFGRSAGDIDRWASGAAESMGLSKRAALESASSFGDLFQQLGFTQTKAVDLSKGTVQLASDLGSFSNLDTADVLERISAAYRGEYDGLQKVIPNINAARVEQEALTLTHKKSTSELTAQDKALAVNAILHKDGARAAGDFARTSGGLANQQRILAAEFENTKAEVGKELLPVMLTLVKVVRDEGVPAIRTVAGILGSIPGPAYAAAAGVGALIVGVRASKSVMDDVRAVSFALGTTMKWMGLRTTEAAAAETLQAGAAGKQAAANDVAAASTTRLGTAMGGLARAGIAGVAALGVIELGKWANGAAAAQVPTNELSQGVANLGSAGDTAFRKLFNRAGWGSFKIDAQSSSEALDHFKDAAEIAFGNSWTDRAQRLITFGGVSAKAEGQIRELDGALAQLAASGHGGQAQDTFAKLAQKMREAGVAEADIARAFPQYTSAANAAGLAASNAAKGAARLAGQGRDEGNALRYVAGSAKTATGATDVNTNAAHRNTAAARAATVGTKEWRAELTKITSGFLKGQEVGDAYQAAVDDMSASIKANGRSLDATTEKGRANRAQLRQLISTGQAVINNMADQRASGSRIRQEWERQRTKLYDVMLQITHNKTKARDYVDNALGKIPPRVSTRVETPGLAAATRGVRGLTSAIRNVTGKTIKLTLDAGGNWVQGTRRVAATGGPVDGWSPNPTADNIPYMLTAGEHVWSVAETQGAGGHGAVQRLRAAARAGQLQGLATGGPVLRLRTSNDIASEGTISNRIEGSVLRWLNANGGGGGGGPMPSGSGVARWAPMMRRALATVGLSQSLLPNELRQIQTESGGNPRAVQGNIGDINNRTGDLAKGLLQIIGATYRAYHWPGTAWNVFDPWSNMTTSLNYQKHRYGSRIASVIGHGHGYDQGGLARGAGLLAKGPLPERMLSPAQTAVFERAMASAAAGGGGGDVYNITLNAPNYLGREETIIDTLDRAARSGRLTRIIRQAA